MAQEREHELEQELEREQELTMKSLFLGAVLVSISAGIIIGYGWKGIELRSVSHWGCENPNYIGPTGDNHSVEVYRLPAYKWLDGRRLGQ